MALDLFIYDKNWQGIEKYKPIMLDYSLVAQGGPYGVLSASVKSTGELSRMNFLRFCRLYEADKIIFEGQVTGSSFDLVNETITAVGLTSLLKDRYWFGDEDEVPVRELLKKGIDLVDQVRWNNSYVKTDGQTIDYSQTTGIDILTMVTDANRYLGYKYGVTPMSRVFFLQPFPVGVMYMIQTKDIESLKVNFDKSTFYNKIVTGTSETETIDEEEEITITKNAYSIKVARISRDIYGLVESRIDSVGDTTDSRFKQITHQLLAEHSVPRGQIEITLKGMPKNYLGHPTPISEMRAGFAMTITDLWEDHPLLSSDAVRANVNSFFVREISINPIENTVNLIVGDPIVRTERLLARLEREVNREEALEADEADVETSEAEADAEYIQGTIDGENDGTNMQDIPLTPEQEAQLYA